MRKYITKSSSRIIDIQILNKCPKLTEKEIKIFILASSYIHDIIHDNNIVNNISVTKLLKRNPELMELFI